MKNKRKVNDKLLNVIRDDGKQFFRHKTPDIDLSKILKPQRLRPRQWIWIIPSMMTAMTVFVLTSILLATTQPQGNFSQIYPGLTPLNQVGLPSLNQRDQTDTLEDGLPQYNAITEAVNAFNADVMDSLDITADNILFSPVSAYTTLALLYEAAAGDSATALANVLAVIDPLAFRQAMLHMMVDMYYQYRVIDTSNQELSVAESLLANGVFIREGFAVKQSYLDVVGQDYLTEVFHTAFDGQGLTSITDWIEDQTHGFLTLEPNELSINSETMMFILNTLYLQSHWQQSFTYLRDDEDELMLLPFFNEVSQVTNNVAMMQKTLANTFYREDEAYHLAIDNLASQGGNRVVIVLPKAGYRVDQLFESGIYDRMQQDMLSPIQGTKLTLTMPSVSIQSKIDLTAIFQADRFGLSSIFNPQTANLSQAFDDGYVQAIVQDTRLELTDIGMTLAAVTQAATGTTSAPEQGTQEVNLMLDRSFAFFVINRQGLIQFSGIVNQPN
jgi:serine protease inhibitor